MELAILSLVRSGETLVHPQVAQVRSPVSYLEDGAQRSRIRRTGSHATELARAPTRYVRTLALCLRDRTLTEGYGECTRLQAFDLAVQVAHSARAMRTRGDTPAHIHAHFAHDPALVGALAASLTGLSFTFTAHARDLLQISPAALAARARAAHRIVTCCRANAAYLEATLPRTGRPPVTVVHHGVDLRRFRPTGNHPASGHLRFVSIGRLVEKKGFPDLIEALRLVKDTGRPFRCDIYGEGPDLDRLTSLRAARGLVDDVRFLGAGDTDRIVQALRDADVFVLTPLVAADGDRDGIPNVLVEAMGSGLPVVATDAGGVAELVEHRHNGLLARAGDPRDVAERLCELMDDVEQRRRLGAAARTTVERAYDVDAAARTLQQLMVPARVEVLA
jgi:glycosyltransferase involved in cell wall biosynthesis